MDGLGEKKEKRTKLSEDFIFKKNTHLVVLFLVAAHGIFCVIWDFWCMAFVVVVCRLSCPEACGI